MLQTHLHLPALIRYSCSVPVSGLRGRRCSSAPCGSPNARPVGSTLSSKRKMRPAAPSSLTPISIGASRYERWPKWCQRWSGTTRYSAPMRTQHRAPPPLTVSSTVHSTPAPSHSRHHLALDGCPRCFGSTGVRTAACAAPPLSHPSRIRRALNRLVLPLQRRGYLSTEPSESSRSPVFSIAGK